MFHWSTFRIIALFFLSNSVTWFLRFFWQCTKSRLKTQKHDLRSRSYTLTKLLISIRNAARMAQHRMNNTTIVVGDDDDDWDRCARPDIICRFRFFCTSFLQSAAFFWCSYQRWIISFRMIFFELITNRLRQSVVVVLCVAFKRAFKIEFYVEISFVIFAVFVCLYSVCFDCSHIGFVLRALWWQQRLVGCTDTPTLLSFSPSRSCIIGKQTKMLLHLILK